VFKRLPQKNEVGSSPVAGFATMVAIVAIIVVGVWWFAFGYGWDITARQSMWFFQEFLERWFFPGHLNPLHFTPITWLLIAVAFGVLAASVRALVVLWFPCFIALLLFVASFCFGFNDHSGSFAEATTFYVENTKDTPNSLSRLVKDTQPNQNGCALYAHNDMRGCIQEGSYDFNWQPRVASATGAYIKISRSSGGVSNTDLLEDTISYVYGAGNKGFWTAIRDGKNKQPVYGVASWDGSGDVTTCKFTGKYSMNKSFGGHWGTNLSDEIADKFPNLFYDDSDRWGYCDDDKPVMVIPVKEQTPYHQRTTMRAGGVLVITGSPSGNAQYRHVQNVKSGDFPGPVYPASLAKEQREAMGMIAGIKDGLSTFGNFGYEETDVATQSGNASEYQLRDSKTGKVYWVTPMKPRGSDSQVLSAYTVIPADEATSGSLNKQSIYVLPDDDPRAINLDTLETRVKESVSQVYSGFFAKGNDGELAEFLPLSADTWQVFAEMNGQVLYRITVPASEKIRPVVTELSDLPIPTVPGATPSDTPDTPPSGNGPATTSSCTSDPSKLSTKDLTTCLSDVARELQRRQGS
jgi:hypothetical protein